MFKNFFKKNLDKSIKEYGINHIGLIMDGNGRWAKKRFLPRNAGHEKGSQVFKTITDYCAINGLSYLTVYAFSTENWKRPKKEVDGLMNILREYFEELLRDKNEYIKKNIKIKFIGDLTKLEKDIYEKANEVSETTKDMTGMTLNIAINYGGRMEITNAFKLIYKDIEKDVIKKEDISEELISKYMYTKNQPDPDFIVRTGGDFRVSNFLLWQIAYSEVMLTDTLWPDFKSSELSRMILDFSSRERRFGGIKNEN